MVLTKVTLDKMDKEVIYLLYMENHDNHSCHYMKQSLSQQTRLVN